MIIQKIKLLIIKKTKTTVTIIRIKKKLISIIRIKLVKITIIIRFIIKYKKQIKLQKFLLQNIWIITNNNLSEKNT